MNRSKTNLAAGMVVATLISVGIPLLGSYWRRHTGIRCALDGQDIIALYQVRISSQEGASHRFCCVACADAWLKRSGGGDAQVMVTDEVSGDELESRSAVYARSRVVTNPVSGNRIHVFRAPDRAFDHVRVYGGSVYSAETRRGTSGLPQADTPFRGPAELERNR